MSEILRIGAPNERKSFEYGIRITDENPLATTAADNLAKYLDRSQDFIRLAALPHQQAILEEVLDGLYEGMPRGYVESPTATGKTYLMARMAEAFYEADMRVLMLCDRRQQADQILGKTGDTGLIQVTDRMDFRDIGTHYEGTKASKDDRVVISTYASLNHFAATGELGEFDAFLCDEAHRGLGVVTRGNLINYCPDAVKVAFTATAAFSRDKNVGQIFEHAYHTTGLKEAIESDLVAPLTCLIYTTEAEIPYLDGFSDFSQKELDMLISLRPRNDKAIEFAKDFVADGRQGVIGCVPGADQAHARMLAKDLEGDFIKLPDGRYKFIRAAAVGSFQSTAENREILRAYEAGQIDVITFVDYLTEGWNSHVASFLIDLQPTTSLVKKTQKIGRVIRKKHDNLQSIVVDFMDIATKGQVTALDALKERQFVIGRSFGAESDAPREFNGSRMGNNREYIQKILNSSLWYELQQINMTKVADLRLRSGSDEPSIRDPLFARYEQLLGKDLVREPRNSMMLPASAINQLSAYMKRYTRQQRVRPEATDIQRYIDEKMPPQADAAIGSFALGHLALQGFDAEPAGLIQYDTLTPDEYDLVEEVTENLKAEAVNRAMEALPAREARILRLRYGMHDGTEWTYEAIGHELDLTRERIRQLEGQALSRLAHLREMAALAF